MDSLIAKSIGKREKKIPKTAVLLSSTKCKQERQMKTKSKRAGENDINRTFSVKEKNSLAFILSVALSLSFCLSLRLGQNAFRFSGLVIRSSLSLSVAEIKRKLNSAHRHNIYLYTQADPHTHIYT